MVVVAVEIISGVDDEVDDKSLFCCHTPKMGSHCMDENIFEEEESDVDIRSDLY